MSKTKRREQARRRAQVPNLIKLGKFLESPEVRIAMGHAEDCTNMEAHFCPPSMGQIGFFMCNVPEDITNYSRLTPI